MPPWARRSAPRRGMQSAVDRCIAVGSLVHGSDDQAQNHAIAAVSHPRASAPEIDGCQERLLRVERSNLSVPGFQGTVGEGPVSGAELPERESTRSTG